MNSNNITALITRPEKEGRVLAEKLSNRGVQAYCQPLFDCQPNQSHAQLTSLLSQVHQPIVIFISVPAVIFANTLQRISSWPCSKIIAVGTSTANALKNLGLSVIIPEKQHSEGLLKLVELQAVDRKDVIIVRGDGGREHLAQSLINKGAKVQYFESYRRNWLQLSPEIVHDWRRNNVNCLVITSNALLKSVVQLVKTSDEYWLNTCIWVVASERIALMAQELGVVHVVNANGANDDAITHAIIKHGTRL